VVRPRLIRHEGRVLRRPTPASCLPGRRAARQQEYGWSHPRSWPRCRTYRTTAPPRPIREAGQDAGTHRTPAPLRGYTKSVWRVQLQPRSRKLVRDLSQTCVPDHQFGTRLGLTRDDTSFVSLSAFAVGPRGYLAASGRTGSVRPSFDRKATSGMPRRSEAQRRLGCSPLIHGLGRGLSC
jgi:hypothetical protein